jgi:tRNA-2-methylthio-N6-dimethylallyladenosine synthase
MNKKLYIKTMGCQMNEYDSEKMADVLYESQGYELTDDPESADLLLVNTCSIREKAQEKVFSQLGRWRKIKEKNPNIKIGVGGCVASQEGEGIAKRAPFVDIVFGPQTLHRLPELIDTADREAKAVIDISFPKVEKFNNFPKARDVQASAFVFGLWLYIKLKD